MLQVNYDVKNPFAIELCRRFFLLFPHKAVKRSLLCGVISPPDDRTLSSLYKITPDSVLSGVIALCIHLHECGLYLTNCIGDGSRSFSFQRL